jgi:hypothetical protein
MMPSPDGPPITDDMRASARTNPNSWLYVLDPAFVGTGVTAPKDVPQWAIVGAYPVNQFGEVEDRFAPNDTYRPSPLALGWPQPRSQLERIIQLAKSGHRPAAELPGSVLDASLLVYDPGDGTWDGTELIVLPDGPTGRLVVPACTSAEHVPPDWPGWRSMRGAEMVPLLRGYPLAINPDGPVSAILPFELLAEAARTRDAEGDDDLRGRHRAD